MHKWYVLQVLSTHEKKVKKALEEHLELKGMSDQIVEILLPNVVTIQFGIPPPDSRLLFYLLI